MLGEFCSIYVELIVARAFSAGAPSNFWLFFAKTVGLIFVAGGALVLGYAFGFRGFKNIWIVFIASVTSILIIEPIVVYTLFKQSPTTGALIGFIFGVLGFAAAMIF